MSQLSNNDKKAIIYTILFFIALSSIFFFGKGKLSRLPILFMGIIVMILGFVNAGLKKGLFLFRWPFIYKGEVSNKIRNLISLIIILSGGLIIIASLFFNP